MDDTPNKTNPETESPFDSNAPLTEAEYSSMLADIALDRAKTVLLRMQKQFEVERCDYDIAQLDAMRAALDRRRVKTVIGEADEADEAEKADEKTDKADDK